MVLNDKKSFLLYGNYETQLKLLSMEERGQLITAIFEYSNNGKVDIPISPLVNMAFSFVKENLDRDRESYLDKCEKNAENGKRGGRPKKSKADNYSSPDREDISSSKTDRFFEEPKKADNDNGNDNDNDNEIDNDIDIDNGIGNGIGEKEKENEKEKAEFSPSSAPCVPDGSAPLSEREKEELIKKGIPRSYIEERAERAVAYARERRSTAFAVLERWWSEDEARQKRLLSKEAKVGKRGGSGYEEREKSYDCDEFFQEAIEKTNLYFKELSAASDSGGG